MYNPHALVSCKMLLECDKKTVGEFYVGHRPPVAQHENYFLNRQSQAILTRIFELIENLKFKISLLDNGGNRP